MKHFFRLIIRVYALIISPLLGYNCRYHPTCSAYADEALKRHGVIKGLVLSIKRIARCHPYSHHPFNDPVPERFTWRDMLGYKRTLQKPDEQENEITG